MEMPSRTMGTCTTPVIGDDVLHSLIYDIGKENEGSAIASSILSFGVQDIEDLIAMNGKSIEDLQYQDGEETKKLTGWDVHKLRCLRAFAFHVNQSGIADPGWTNINRADYNQFRTSEVWQNAMTSEHFLPIQPRQLPPSPPSMPPSRMSQPERELASFRKGIKRDPSLFPKLKEATGWDKFKLSTEAQAKAQGISEVLDPNYTPSTIEENDLFQAKQEFMFSVFDQTLLLDHGKALVRKHSHDSNAQAIYRELETYMQESTKSSLDSSRILAYLSSVRLGPGSDWRGTYEGFIIHWVDKVHLFNELVPARDSLILSIIKFFYKTVS